MMEGASPGAFAFGVEKERDSVDGEIPSKPRLMRLIWRGLCRRCPRCGLGAQFRKWFTLHDRCAHCDLVFEPHSGDTWGFWIIGDRIFLVAAIVLIYFGVRPQDWLWRGVFLGVVIAATVLTMPQRQGVCTALDYYCRVKHGLET